MFCLLKQHVAPTVGAIVDCGAVEGDASQLEMKRFAKLWESLVTFSSIFKNSSRREPKWFSSSLCKNAGTWWGCCWHLLPFYPQWKGSSGDTQTGFIILLSAKLLIPQLLQQPSPHLCRTLHPPNSWPLERQVDRQVRGGFWCKGDETAFIQ